MSYRYLQKTYRNVYFLFMILISCLLVISKCDCPILQPIKVRDSSICSFCSDGQILFENKFCVSQCPTGYIIKKGPFIQQCQKCLIQQVRVPNSARSQCVCSIQYFQKLSTRQCTACHYSCLTCLEETSQDCLTCDVSNKIKVTFRQLIRSPGGLTGICKCPTVGFYEQDLNIRCIACHPDCRTCSGPEQTECIECNRQRQNNQFGLCQCKSGFTSQLNGTCTCLNPRYQVNGACIDPLNPCGLNQIFATVNIKSNGKGNGKGRNLTTKCQCRNGFNRVKGQCLPCGQNQEYDSKKGLCRCIKEANKLNDGTCIVCEKDKHFDKEEQKCICKNKNHELNQRGECIQCPKKSIYYDGQCLCINNYFMNSKGKCQKCHKSIIHPSCKRVNDQDL